MWRLLQGACRARLGTAEQWRTTCAAVTAASTAGLAWRAHRHLDGPTAAARSASSVVRCEAAPPPKTKQAIGGSGGGGGGPFASFRARRLTQVTHHRDSSDDAAAAVDDAGGGSSKHTELKTKQPLTMRVSHAEEIEDAASSSNNKHMSGGGASSRFFGGRTSRAVETAAGPSATSSTSTAPAGAFPKEVVGINSCHGIEPHPYIIGGGTTIFSDLSDASIVTLLESKINQDRGCACYPFGNDDRTALFAAFDGHGQRGELVASYAMDEIPNRLVKHPKFHDDLNKALHDTFVNVDEDIREAKEMAPYYSGSTACVVLVRDKSMIVSNVGDSRAVLASRRRSRRPRPAAHDPKREEDETAAESRIRLFGAATAAAKRQRIVRRSSHDDDDDDDDDKNDSLVATDLSREQTAACPIERSRVLKRGGYVTPPEREGFPARIWNDSRCTQIGLAMSRSLGDHCLKTKGVIPDPVITHHTLTDDDEFLIIATDGIWEFIGSDEAVRVVEGYLNKGSGASEACLGLIQLAIERWKVNEGGYRDDITAIVVRISDLWPSSSNEGSNSR